MNRNSDILTMVKCTVSLVLLIVYLWISFYPSIHQEYDHHEDKKICTPNEDLNPCHLAVYHVESNIACEHPVHFQTDEPCCELCDFTFAQIQFHEFETIELAELSFGQAYFTAFDHSKLRNYNSTHFSRGPPSSIFKLS